MTIPFLHTRNQDPATALAAVHGACRAVLEKANWSSPIPEWADAVVIASRVPRGWPAEVLMGAHLMVLGEMAWEIKEYAEVDPQTARLLHALTEYIMAAGPFEYTEGAWHRRLDRGSPTLVRIPAEQLELASVDRHTEEQPEPELVGNAS